MVLGLIPECLLVHSTNGYTTTTTELTTPTMTRTTISPSEEQVEGAFEVSHMNDNEMEMKMKLKNMAFNVNEFSGCEHD